MVIKHKQTIKEFFTKLTIMFFGGALGGIAFNAFILPYEILSGGISGLALIITYLTPFMPLYLIIIALNIPLFIWGFFELDKKLIFYSLIGMITYSLAIPLTQPFIPVPDVDIFLAVIFSGLLIGISSGTIIKFGGSSGGTEIISLILKKKFNLSVGTVSFTFNSCLIMIALLFFPTKIALYTLISMWVTSQTADFILEGLTKNKAVTIITTKRTEVSFYIMTELNRGATIYNACGGFSGQEKTVITCVINNFEFAKLRNEIPHIDPDAFMYVSDTVSVAGGGFNKG
jgi:uncharacterized membrane-anchored protein YitT (DUF2179 family)